MDITNAVRRLKRLRPSYELTYCRQQAAYWEKSLDWKTHTGLTKLLLTLEKTAKSTTQQ